MEPTTEQGAFEILRLPLSMPDAPSRLNDVSTVHCHLIGKDNDIRGSSTESPCADRNQIEASTCIDTRPEEDAAQYRLGVALVRLGNSSLAAEWLGRSARQGYAEAQYLLGFDASCGRCWSDAAAWLRHAAEQGHEGSLNLLRESAEAGNPHSQYHFGEMHLVGLGVDPSVADGLLWVLCAAEQGHAVALSLLGAAVNQGFDWVPQLGHLLRLIEARGDAEAQWSLRSQECAHGYRASLADGFSSATRKGDHFDLASPRLADRTDAETQYRLGVYCLERGDSSFAFGCMRRAARQGHTNAQFALGCDHMARGSWSDAVAWLRHAAARGHEDSSNLLRDSAEAGNPHSQWILGEMYSLALGGDVERAEGVLWALCAAKHGHLPAWNLLNSAVRAECDWAPQLRQLLRQVANYGAAQPQCRLGRLHLDAAVAERDTWRATNWSSLAASSGHGFTLDELRGVAEGGDAEAQWRLGRLYLDGTAVEQNAREAAKWLGLAAGSGHDAALEELHGVAEGGDAEAQWRLGRLCFDGVALEQDARDPAHWLGLAAGSGHGAALEALHGFAEEGGAAAQWRLGQLYLDGLVVERDPQEAAKWLGLAARSGHGAALEELRLVAGGGEKEAQWRLGTLHLEGEVVERDVRAAAAWFGMAAGRGHGDALDGLRQIAEGGDAAAQWRLGLVYLHGDVVERNAREAAKWLGLAALSGHGAALEELQRVVEGCDGANWDALLVAMHWIQRVADTGHSEAWTIILEACEAGDSGATRFLLGRLKYREQPAVRLLQEKAARGNAWAKSILAGLDSEGDISARQLMPWIKCVADTGHTKAWTMILRACEAGDSGAIRFLLGRLKNRERPAARLLQEKARRGKVWAKSILADLNSDGDGSARQLFSRP